MSKTVSKEQWIEEGLRVLYKEGLGGLLIDKLCINLGVTKGSFYHHFENVEDFHRKLLDHYEQSRTNRIEEIVSGENDARAQLAKLTQVTVDFDKDLEIAIRNWALRNPIARDYQRRVDEFRIDFLESLYSHFMDKSQARLRARLGYCLFVGAQSVIPPIENQELRSLFDFLRIEE